MKKILRNYLLSRIDKALDDARPLQGWLAWIVCRDEELRHYYETMLEIEVELRFSDLNSQSVFQDFTIAKPLSVDNAGKSQNPSRRFRHVFVASTAAVLVFMIMLPLFVFMNQESSISKSDPVDIISPHVSSEDEEETIDFARFLATVKQVNSDVSFPPNPFSDLPLYDFHLDMVSEFSEHPLESTLTILERIRIINRYKIEEQNIESEKLRHDSSLFHVLESVANFNVGNDSFNFSIDLMFM